MDLKKTLNLERTERFESEFNGEKFWFEAKTAKLSPSLMQQFNDYFTNRSPLSFAVALADIITAWDVEMDGPFPPTADNLSIVPRDFLEHLLDVLSEAWTGKKPTPQQSQSTSEAAAK